jgi:hypothetical protein
MTPSGEETKRSVGSRNKDENKGAIPNDLKKCGNASLSLRLLVPVILKRDKGPNRRGQYISRVEEDESRCETVMQEITHDF